MEQIPFVIISLTLICSAMTVVFYVAWRAFGYPQHALTWSLAFLIASIQWACNAAYSYGVFPNHFVYWVTVSFLGPFVSILSVTGYRQRANKYLNIPMMAGAILLTFGATLWFSYVQPHIGLRLAILPGLTVCTSLWTAWIVYDVPRPKRPIEKTLISLYLITATVEVFIISIALSQGAVADQEILNLYRGTLFLAMPVIFSIAGVMALATIASDLADQATKAAEDEIEAQKRETERGWNTLTDAIEAIPDLVALDDGHGNIVTCNSAFSELIGVPQDQISGKRTFELFELYWQQLETMDGVKLSSAQDCANKMWRSLTTGERLEAVTKDKRNFIVDCGYVRGGGFIMVGRDVTQLSNTRIRLEAAIHSAPIAFAFYDNELKLVACNTTYEKMLNKPQRWLADQSFDTIVRTFMRRVDFGTEDPFGKRSSWMIKYLDSIEARETIQSIALMDDGTWYDITSQPVAEGGYVTVATDITSRHMLEKDLERNEKQLRDILEGQPFPALVMRREDKKILFTSAAAVEALSGNTAENLGEDFRNQLNNKPDVTAPIFMAAESQKDPITEVQLNRLDGSSFPSLFSSQIINYEGTSAEVVSFIDMSTIRNLESELETQQQALFQSQKLNAMGTLLAGVAHELNNPLTVVVANAHVLTLDNNDPQTTARVQKITDAAERCSNIVKSFLDVARKSSGDKANFDMVQCISKSIELTEIGFRDQEIKVTTQFENNLPAVNGDMDQIGQVVMNLLINAKQAIAEQDGAKEINVSCQLNTRKSMIELLVNDNGPGVPEEIREQIFDPFFTTKGVGHGTGMGLSLVHGIITGHGGTIELLKTEQKGAHFRVCLPHIGKPLTEADIRKAPPTTQKLKLLVVDDEEDVLEALEDTLIILGHDVLGVGSGKAALSALRNEGFDGILSDLRMPEMDGADLYENLKKEFPEMVDKIAFITGNNLSESAQQFLAACKRPSLGKPFSPEQLSSLIAELELA